VEVYSIIDFVHISSMLPSSVVYISVLYMYIRSVCHMRIPLFFFNFLGGGGARVHCVV
jgi:hypothetical protein